MRILVTSASGANGSGNDRVLALDLDGDVVRDSGPIPGLDPGGAEFGSASGATAVSSPLSWPGVK